MVSPFNICWKFILFIYHYCLGDSLLFGLQGERHGGGCRGFSMLQTQHSQPLSRDTSSTPVFLLVPLLGKLEGDQRQEFLWRNTTHWKGRDFLPSRIWVRIMVPNFLAEGSQSSSLTSWFRCFTKETKMTDLKALLQGLDTQLEVCLVLARSSYTDVCC